MPRALPRLPKVQQGRLDPGAHLVRPGRSTRHSLAIDLVRSSQLRRPHRESRPRLVRARRRLDVADGYAALGDFADARPGLQPGQDRARPDRDGPRLVPRRPHQAQAAGHVVVLKGAAQPLLRWRNRFRWRSRLDGRAAFEVEQQRRSSRRCAGSSSVYCASLTSRRRSSQLLACRHQYLDPSVPPFAVASYQLSRLSVVFLSSPSPSFASRGIAASTPVLCFSAPLVLSSFLLE